MEEEIQSHCVLTKGSRTFLYNQILHRDKKLICRFCFQSFGRAQTSERHINDCSEMNDKQMIKVAKKVSFLNSKTIQEK